MTKPAPAPTAAAADSVGSVSSNRFAQYSATVLALTTSTVGGQAAIVYFNPTDVVLNVGDSTTVDFKNGDFGTGTGVLVDLFAANYLQLYGGNGGVSALAFDGGTEGRLSRFTAGQSISSTGGSAGWKTGFSYADYHSEAGYPWNPGTGSISGYVGVRLNDIGDGPIDFYYGWLRMTYDKTAQTVTLHDFAYQSTQNGSINAGAVPEPAETGLLAALGAGGLATWRKLRQKRRSTAA